MSFLVKSAFILVAVYALVLAIGYFGQRRLLYFPDPRRTSPVAVGLRGVEEQMLATPDGEQVVAWWAKAAPGRPTLLYFHGNGGSLEFRSERVRRYQQRGIGLFMMSYRGYSGSTGSPSEAANVADGKLAYDWLVKAGVAPADIILYGESLGSGVAVQVAVDHAVSGIILDAPYTSIADIGASAYPFLPVQRLLKDRYDTIRYIGQIRAPMLIVHGERDRIVPVAMGRSVFAAAPQPKEIVTFPEAGHADHYMYGSYDRIFDWVGRLRAGRIVKR